MAGYHAVLGVPAVDVSPQPLLFGAVLVDTLQAVLATAALHPVVHQHPVSRLQTKGIRARLHHLARHVQPEDAGESAGGATGADA